MDKFIVIQEKILNVKYIRNIEKAGNGTNKILIRIEYSFYDHQKEEFICTDFQYDTIEERDKDFEQIRKELLRVTTKGNPNERG